MPLRVTISSWGQEPPFVLIEILHENVIGKWREGSCDYASAAAVECVDYACLLRACHFYSVVAASGSLRQC